MTNFMNADLTGACLEKVKGQRAAFLDAKLPGVRLAQADLAQSCFEGADLRQADFTGANLEQALFNRTVCQAAKFSKAHCPYADFSHADLRAADFSGAQLFRAKLHRIREEQTKWQGANREAALETDPDLAAAEDDEGPPVK